MSYFGRNYDAELFAFGKRLGEEFQASSLRQAFLHNSYLQQQQEKNPDTQTEASSSNQDLIQSGETIISAYTLAYLRYHFPKLPEEGIEAVAAALTSQSQLSHLSKNLGMTDLILAADFPVEERTLRNTFCAVVSALARDSGLDKAELFVQDFVLTALAEMDINEIWYVKNPLEILTKLLTKSGHGAPETRILRQAGAFTVVPVYISGIYLKDRLIGEGTGESVEISEEIAARDCLARLWETDSSKVLKFGAFARKLDLTQQKARKNATLAEQTGEHLSATTDAFPKEPLNIDEMYAKYKDDIEPALGITYRKHLRHKFYFGSPMKSLTKTKSRKPYPDQI